MGAKDPRVDAYIEKAAPFAQPILTRIRADFHQASTKVEEDLKWGCPAFVHQGIVGGMAAFKRHVAYGFWRADELPDPENLFEGKGGRSLFTAKVFDLSELPTRRTLQAYVKRAVALNVDRAVDAEPRKKAAGRTRARSAPKPPPDLADALRGNDAARATFEGFPPSAQRDYVEWITGAKRPETRAKRLATTLEWLAEGKRRNWKYERC